MLGSKGNSTLNSTVEMCSWCVWTVEENATQELRQWRVLLLHIFEKLYMKNIYKTYWEWIKQVYKLDVEWIEK